MKHECCVQTACFASDQTLTGRVSEWGNDITGWNETKISKSSCIVVAYRKQRGELHWVMTYAVPEWTRKSRCQGKCHQAVLLNRSVITLLNAQTSNCMSCKAIHGEILCENIIVITTWNSTCLYLESGSPSYKKESLSFPNPRESHHGQIFTSLILFDYKANWLCLANIMCVQQSSYYSGLAELSTAS